MMQSIPSAQASLLCAECGRLLGLARLSAGKLIVPEPCNHGKEHVLPPLTQERA